MLQHFVAVAAALLVGVWSTVLTQYQEFRYVEPEHGFVVEAPLPGAEVQNPLDALVADVVRSASSSPLVPPSLASTTPTPAPVPLGPVSPPPPSVPFTPLPVPPPPIIPATSTPSVIPTIVEQIDEELSDEALLKSAVVNIVCVSGGGLRGTSGSGVIVDSKGLILTVAHVAQHLLLRDYPEEDTRPCYIRTGSPAKNAYSAELVYLSPSWLSKNETTFLKSNPKGTGENDFAFLVITGTVTSSPLPSSFPFIPLSLLGTDIDEGDRVGTGSYAAEFLTSSEVRSSLYPTIKFADIEELVTFSDDYTLDLISVSAGSAAQEGSSGGVVINEDDRVIGAITTRTVKTDLSLRTLQAITVDHMRRSFRGDTGENMDAYLRQSTPVLIEDFRDLKEELQDTLLEALEDASS